MDLRLFPLLARRASDLARWRVEAMTPTEQQRLRLSADYAMAARLEAEALVARRNRAGDIPYDFTPDPVPVNERSPYDAAPQGPSDLDALQYAREIAQHVRSRGVRLAESEERALAQLESLPACVTDTECEDAADAAIAIQNQLALYDDPGARTLAREISAQANSIRVYGYDALGIDDRGP